MSRSTFALVVGIVSATWHLFVGAALLVFGGFFEEVIEEAEKDTQDTEFAAVKEVIEDYVFGYIFIGMLFCLFMFIVSILLAVGAKKQRPSYIAPWIYVTVISLIMFIVEIFADVGGDDDSKALEIITCVFYAAIWYPIFEMYKKMRAAQKTVVVSSPVNPHYMVYETPEVKVSHDIAEFSHTAKYVHAQEATAVAHGHAMYPGMPTTVV